MRRLSGTSSSAPWSASPPPASTQPWFCLSFIKIGGGRCYSQPVRRPSGTSSSAPWSASPPPASSARTSLKLLLENKSSSSTPPWSCLSTQLTGFEPQCLFSPSSLRAISAWMWRAEGQGAREGSEVAGDWTLRRRGLMEAGRGWPFLLSNSFNTFLRLLLLVLW